MKFTLEIGEAERHTLEYQFNQLFGRLVIRVNRQEVKKSVRLFNEPLVDVHILMVGQREPGSVRIEKERKLLFGQKNRLYVNDRLVKVYEGV